MANDLTISNGAGKAQLPAHLQAAFEGQTSNIITGERGASLSVKGKVFTVTNDGESTPLMKRDAESGEEIPRSVLPVVVLDYGVKLGRAYYEGAYDPTETKGPTCWSLDSVIPEPEVENKQSAKCANCPMAQKGSTVTDNGKPATACGQHRILVVVPAVIDAMKAIPPLRLRIAQTSNYDGRSPDLRAQGKFAFQNFLDNLKARGIPNTRAVVTSLSFDTQAAYPKLLFKATKYVDEDQHALIEEILAGDKVEEILAWTGTQAVAKGINHRPEVVAVAPSDDDEEDEDVIAAKAVVAKAAEKKATKAKGKAAEKKAAEHPADAALAKAGEKNPALTAKDVVKGTGPAATASKAIGDFVAPAMEDGEDEDDYGIRVSQARKAHRLAQAAALEAAKAPAPAAAPKAFVAPAREEDEDEDDHAIRVAQAKKAWKAAQAAPVAAKAPPAFEAPVQGEDEDEDDYAVRVAQARKAYKAMHGAPAAAKAVVHAEPVPKAEEKPAEKFLPEAAALAAIGDDEEEAEVQTKPAPKATKAKAEAKPKPPIEAKAIPVSDDVAKLLDTWDE